MKGLPNWKTSELHIQRRFEARSTSDATSLMTLMGQMADEANHHPEVQWVANTLDIVLTTHDAGGITHLDVEMATQIDRALARA